MGYRLTKGNSFPLSIDTLIAGLPQPIQQKVCIHFGTKPSLALVQRLQSIGYQQEALSVLQLLVEAEPTNSQALYQLALAWNRAGKKREAKDYMQQHYEQRMRENGMQPQDNVDTLQYLLSTEGFAEPPVQIPRAYVENLFDRFSGQFDERLLNRLDYKTPEILFEVFCDVAKNQEAFRNCKNLVDLGCGTGLAGKNFKSICETLIGVELSSEMIEKARLTGVYNHLVVSEIVAYLASDSVPIDVFVATDVFNYFGEIEAVLIACRKRQSSGGLLAFSVEALAVTQGNQDVGFKLASSGRFQHQQQYVISCAQSAGYAVLCCSESVLRHEDGNDVNGYLFVLIAK